MTVSGTCEKLSDINPYQTDSDDRRTRRVISPCTPGWVGRMVVVTYVYGRSPYHCSDGTGDDHGCTRRVVGFLTGRGLTVVKRPRVGMCGEPSDPLSDDSGDDHRRIR